MRCSIHLFLVGTKNQIVSIPQSKDRKETFSNKSVEDWEKQGIECVVSVLRHVHWIVFIAFGYESHCRYIYETNLDHNLPHSKQRPQVVQAQMDNLQMMFGLFGLFGGGVIARARIIFFFHLSRYQLLVFTHKHTRTRRAHPIRGTQSFGIIKMNAKWGFSLANSEWMRWHCSMFNCDYMRRRW